jgi:hypothetical protein
VSTTKQNVAKKRYKETEVSQRTVAREEAAHSSGAFDARRCRLAPAGEEKATRSPRRRGFFLAGQQVDMDSCVKSGPVRLYIWNFPTIGPYSLTRILLDR